MILHLGYRYYLVGFLENAAQDVAIKHAAAAGHVVAGERRRVRIVKRNAELLQVVGVVEV